MRPAKPPKWQKVSHCPTTGKIQHRTENGAQAHALRLTCGRGYDGDPVHVYQCPHCEKWHVGHLRTYRDTFAG